MKRILATFTFLMLSLTVPIQAATLNGAAVAGIGAASGNGYTESLTWTQGSSCILTGVTCGYNVYSCVGTCTVTTGTSIQGCSSTTNTWTKIGSAVTSTSFSDSAPAGGVVSYCATDVATGSGWSATESGPSNVFTQTFPVAPPQGLAGTHN